MSSRTDEVFRILGIGGNTQAKEKPQADQATTTSRQAEIENILSSAPAIQQTEQAGTTAQTSTLTAVPQSPTATAPLQGEPNTSFGAVAPPSPQGEGRSAEQIQQEIADSRKQLAQLGNDAAYVLTAEPGAELGRQMDEVRARIKSLTDELNALKAPNTNAERDSLIQRMNDITANEGYATTVEQADALTHEKQDTRQRLHELDEELGNADRFYDSGERFGAVVKGALNQTGAAYTNFMGTLQGVGNRLNELSPDENAALYGIDYGELEKEEQRLSYKADTMAESAAKDIEQAKEGLSALGQAGVDISTNLIQMGIDAAGRAAGLGMIPFFVRASGGAMQEARQAGASTGQQLAYGLTKGAIEVGTEKLFDGLAGIFGKGAADDVIEGLIGKLTGSNTGRTLLRAFAGAAGEGTEEVISDLLDPFAKLIYNDQSLKEAWENRADLRDQMLYDYLIGAALGGFGGVASIATGQNARKNAELAGVGTQTQAEQEQAAQPAAQQNLTEEERVQIEDEWWYNQEKAAAEAAVDSAIERYFSFANDSAANRSDPNYWLETDALWNDVKKARQALDDVYNKRIETPFPWDGNTGEKSGLQNIPGEEDTRPYAAQPTAETPQSALQTAPLAGEPLNVRRGTQEQAAETAQEAQESAVKAETPPTTQNAPQAASDELNRQSNTSARQNAQTSELGQAVRETGVDPEMVYNELNNIYGAIPTGETPARDVQVPQRISEEEAVGRTARTIMEAEATPDKRLGSVREAVVDGKFSYAEISNQELADSAAQRIESDGWQKSLNDWTAAVRQNQANENLAAMGAQLLNNAGNSDMSAEQYIDLATDYNRLMHNLGRGLAAARILKTLSPEGKLYGILRSVQSMVDEANRKYNVEIDQALIDEYRAQTTDEGRDAVISKMQQNIADQVPSTWMDKFTALRYTNMLGNFKTQIRNVGGNILMTLGRIVKDRLAAVIESAASAASGGKVERTKSFWAGTPLYGEAMRDFINVEREAMGEAKFSDIGREFDLAVQEKLTIFKNNGKWGTSEAKTGIGRSAMAKGARKISDLGMAGMEAYRKATNWAMEQGDQIFVRINYADALAGWLKAHGISSIADADTDTLNRARQYAIKQAQEATFRDTNSVSQFVSTFDKGWGKTGFGRGAQKIMQGIAPFRKTPANVAVRAEEYSPLGILNTAYKAFEAKQGKNDVTWSDVIDSAAKTLTGSGISVLGYLMAAAGSARGKEEDEKKASFESMQGLQDYSIILPNGKSVSMDWVAPYSIPFFMGVLTQEAAADGGLSWDDAGKILGAITDPMLEMSMLSGLNDALDNISQYNGDADALPQFLLNSFAGYLSQGLTNTLLGQAELAAQKTRQTTYTDSTLKIPTSLQYILGKASAKTPGVDYNQQDYIDAWGRKQSTGTAGERIFNSFINPAYVNEDRSTPVDDELLRLYDAGQTNVLPQKAARSTQVNGERLSPEEYEAYSITKGQQSLELVQDFIESDAYQDMSDEARAKVISDLYSFAASRAAKKIADGREESYTSDWDDEAKLSDVVGYITTKTNLKAAQDSKNYTLLDALLDTVTEQKKDVQAKLDEDFSMLDKLIYGKEHGVDAKTIYVAKGNADVNSNGSVSQEELWNYLGLQKNMPATTKSVLWDILTTGKTGYSEYAEKQK